MTVFVTEGETCWDTGLRLADLPPLIPDTIELSARGGRLGITAVGVAGTLGLMAGNVLQVRPKIGDANFLRMLYRADGRSITRADLFQDPAKSALGEEKGFEVVVAGQFMRSLAEIHAMGFLHDRQNTNATGLVARGQIRPLLTSRRLSMRDPAPVVSSFKKRTMQIPEHRILHAAGHRAVELLSAVEALQWRPTWQSMAHRFGSAPFTFDDVQVVRRRISEGHYNGWRDYYQRALLQAEVLLGTSGLSPQFGSQFQTSGILIRTASVFERYLRRVLSETYSVQGLIVAKGGYPSLSLYDDGTIEIIPDIVVSAAGDAILIADAKYKNPTPADHYQMAAYLRRYQCKCGVLFAPGDQTSCIPSVQTFWSSSSVRVCLIRLPIWNLDITEEYLAGLLPRLGVV